MGLIKAHTSGFKSYTEAEKTQLAKKYTPEQLEALEAGEAAIDLEDMAAQGVVRHDPFALKYLDDFSQIHPVIDKPVRAPAENYDPNLRLKSEDDDAADLARFVENFPEDIPEDEARLQWMKFIDENRNTFGKEEAERNPVSWKAPELPKMHNPRIRYPRNDESNEDPMLKRLYHQTGFDQEQVRRFRIKNLVKHRVVNQTRLGKIQSQYYLTIAGDGKGLLGIGEGKSVEMDDAKRQAMRAAIRNMQPIARYEQRTIYGEVTGKVGAVELQLMARPPGFGIRCQQYIFEMCRCAGISDLAARVTRSRNPMNVVKAAFQALKSQRIPDEIARARGKKLVDVRKVYYGGQV
ncbi:MAG: 28S ribosomal protein S5, mitochondrial [Sclerophora amabilis]|nr:MAG: 28S ribosomal protein S5, mitochondrial [Sclerophora amabilis]